MRKCRGISVDGNGIPEREPLCVTFAVRGHPRPQPRGRVARRGNHLGIFDPGTADEWKALVVIAARDLRPAAPLTGAIEVDWLLFMPRPKRLYRKKDPDGPILCVMKPDRDNADKAILDALTQNGWWGDDCVVACGWIATLYHAKGGIPGAIIRVSQVDAASGQYFGHEGTRRFAADAKPLLGPFAYPLDSAEPIV